MMCPACGAVVADGARFCSSCGRVMRPAGDERRVATVLFGDLVGFTTLSETLDPEHVKNLVDRCFERLAADITSFGGQVDKIIGDAIVALFGAPVAHEDDAERAVRAALRMQETIATFGAEAAGHGVRMRIGVNTGEVLVGALRAGGSTTAMGDVVNTASRLQTSAAPGEVLVGPATYASTHAVIAYDSRGLIQAKGREEPVPAWIAREAILPPGHRPRRVDVPLVGRNHELAVLRHSIEGSISHGRAQVVLLLGDPGLGKTRITDEIGDWAACAHGAVVLQGRCVPYGEANLWWPVAEALRQACQVEPGASLPSARAAAAERVAVVFGRPRTDPEVVRVSNGLIALMGYEPSREVDPTSVREEGVRSLIAFIEASSRRQPVVIELSDLHWADTMVLELIDTIFDRLQRHPVVLLATSRPSLLDHWTPRPGRFNVVRMHLDPLDKEASTELLTSLLGVAPSSDVARALIDRSGGNPFFLEELVALLGEESPVPAAADGATSDSGPSMTNLPDTLRGIVAARLDALSSDERAVVQDAAVLGRREPVKALQEMANALGRDIDVDRAVAELVDKEILVIDEQNMWSFKSDLVREVAYNTITKYDRARRHEGIAEWLESHLPADGSLPDIVVHSLSHHLGLAAELANELGALDQFAPDLPGPALTWVERAAERAAEAEALPQSIKLFSQALILIGPEPTADRLRLLLSRAEARTEAWELPGARADVEEAAAEAEALGDAHCGARALLVLGQVEQKAGSTEAAMDALNAAADRFQELGDEDGRAEAFRQIGMADLFRGRFVEAEQSVTTALEAFRAVHSPRGEAWALQNLAWIAFLTGQVDEAERRLHDSVATFSEIGDTGGMAWALGLFAYVRFQQGRIDEAEALGSQILAEARTRGDRWAAGMMLVLLASVRLWTGRTNEAIELAVRAQESFDAIHDPFGRMQAGTVLGRALAMSGRIDDGLLAIAEARRAADRGDSDDTVNLAKSATVGIAVQLGELERLTLEADGDLFILADDTVRDVDRTVALALASVQRGDPGAALARLEDLATRTNADHPYATAVRALAEAAVGEGTDAIRSAGQLDDLPGTTYLDRVMASMAAGLAEARVGHRVEALHWLGVAREMADGTGDVVAQAITRLAEATGLSGLGEATAAEARAEAQVRLDELGLQARGWVTAFDLAVGATPAAVGV